MGSSAGHLRASQGVEAFTELSYTSQHSSVQRGKLREAKRQAHGHTEWQNQDLNPSPPSQATSLGNQNQKPLLL